MVGLNRLIHCLASPHSKTRLVTGVSSNSAYVSNELLSSILNYSLPAFKYFDKLLVTVEALFRRAKQEPEYIKALFIMTTVE